MAQLCLFEYEATSSLWRGDEVMDQTARPPTPPTHRAGPRHHHDSHHNHDHDHYHLHPSNTATPNANHREYGGWGLLSSRALGNGGMSIQSHDGVVVHTPEPEEAPLERRALDGMSHASTGSPDERARHRGFMARLWQAQAAAQRKDAQAPRFSPE